MRRGLLLAGGLSLALHAALFYLPLPPRRQPPTSHDLSFRLLPSEARTPRLALPKAEPAAPIRSLPPPAPPAPAEAEPVPAAITEPRASVEPMLPTPENPSTTASQEGAAPAEPAGESTVDGASTPATSETGPLAAVPTSAPGSPNGPSPAPPRNAPPVLDPVPALVARLEAYIEANKTYPEAARRRGAEGVVRIALVIGPGGELRSLRRAASSGSSLLDKAAQDLLRAAFPLELELPEELELVLAIRYQLKR